MDVIYSWHISYISSPNALHPNYNFHIFLSFPFSHLLSISQFLYFPFDCPNHLCMCWAQIEWIETKIKQFCQWINQLMEIMMGFSIVNSNRQWAMGNDMQFRTTYFQETSNVYVSSWQDHSLLNGGQLMSWQKRGRKEEGNSRKRGIKSSSNFPFTRSVFCSKTYAKCKTNK